MRAWLTIAASPFFEVVGSGDTHYGLFPGYAAPDVFGDAEISEAAPVGGCC